MIDEIVNTVKERIDRFRLNYAISEAKRLHKITNHKYFVMDVFGKYRVLNMRGINELKRKKILPKSYDWLHAEKHALFIAN